MATEFVFSPEVESNFTGILWHEPWRLPDALKELEPQVHITQAHLRLVLEAIRIVYGDCGDCDWALVVSVLREQGNLEKVGGLEALNALWKADESIATPDAIFFEYLAPAQNVWPRARGR